jgi:hypothetical protein
MIDATRIDFSETNRRVPQFAYVGGALAALPRSPCCRRLDLSTGEDRQLLTHLLRRSSPISARSAVEGLGGAFVLNLLDRQELRLVHRLITPSS